MNILFKIGYILDIHYTSVPHQNPFLILKNIDVLPLIMCMTKKTAAQFFWHTPSPNQLNTWIFGQLKNNLDLDIW